LSEDDEDTDAIPELAEITETDRESTEKFLALSDSKLMNVVKNYRKYNYTEGERSLAIGILEDRGISQRRLKVLGFYENKNYDRAQKAYKRFKKNSNKAFIFYIPSLIIGILLPVLDNNVEMPIWLLLGTLVVGIIITLVYLYYLIKSFFNYQSLHESLDNKLDFGGILAFLLLGLPFYFASYFYTLRIAREKIQQLN
ncbi:MAG: hypothetical protein AAF617_17655, partial [Bacteroidota bacterium]